MEQIPKDRVSIAPMLAVTTTYERYLLRLLSRRCTLYTEMFVDNTIAYCSYKNNLIDFSELEHPIVAQIGGNNPETMAICAEELERRGYDEININCGCPSPLVSSRCFGAKLMLDPERVRQICDEIQKRVHIPITIKCRTGVDDRDSFEDLVQFIRIVSGMEPHVVTDSVAEQIAEIEHSSIPRIRHFIIHARKCWTHGVNTRENRRIPPLCYDWVFRLLDVFPELEFTINGGIRSYAEMQALLERTSPIRKRKVRGVMIGRMVLQHPWICRHLDTFFYHTPSPELTRREVLCRYVAYVEQCEEKHKDRKADRATLIKPLLNFFNGEKRGGSVFRRVLTEKVESCASFRNAVEQAIQCFDDSVLDRVDSAESHSIDDYSVVIE